MAVMTSNIPASSSQDSVGAIDALANYWLTKIDYETHPLIEDADDAFQVEEYGPNALPEFNLRTSASEAFFAYSIARGKDRDKANAHAAGFQIGFSFALALCRDPFNPEAKLKAALEQYFPSSGSGEAQ